MKPLYIAFVWNQHQPYYCDRTKKEYIMPWSACMPPRIITGWRRCLRIIPG